MVKKIVNIITTQFETVKHTVFFDNFFTGYDVLKDFASINMKAVETVRKNRTLRTPNNMIGVKNLIEKQFIFVTNRLNIYIWLLNHNSSI